MNWSSSQDEVKSTGDHTPVLKKRYQPMDPFGISDVAREYGFTSTDQLVLMMLALRMEWRSWEWQGTYKDLVEATRLSHRSVVKSVASLADKGLVHILFPLRQGTEGRLRIVCADRLAKVKSPPPWASTSPVVAKHQEEKPTSSGPVLDEKWQIDQIEQEKHGVQEVRRQRGVGESYEPQASGGDVIQAEEICASCGVPKAGHPFTDCEPRPEWTLYLDPEDRS